MIRLLARLFKTLALLATGAAAGARLRRSSTQESGAAPSVEADEKDGAGRFAWKRRLRTIVAFLVVVGVGGLLVAASGIVPIKASSEHWAMTRWFLDWSKSRSVSTHSIGIKAPSRDSLASPLLVLKGAGHYETGCQPCHGSPALREPPVAQAMTPHPPYLPPGLADWDAKELFYIVKHGIKFTGMPEWPASGTRDDEVWAVVAFLLKLPDLDAEAYAQLVSVDDAAVDADAAPLRQLTAPDRQGAAARSAAVRRLAARSCARCHGAQGEGRGVGAFPRLAGQKPDYLYNSLLAYARGERHSGMMEPIAAGLSAEEMRALARFFARQGPAARRSSTSPALQAADVPLIGRGEAIAQRGLPGDGIPSCADCHGPGQGRRNAAYPLLAGQYAEYLALQLELFKEEHRGGSPYVRLMHPTAHRLTPEQIRAVSLYYASLAVAPGGPAQ